MWAWIIEIYDLSSKLLEKKEASSTMIINNQGSIRPFFHLLLFLPQSFPPFYGLSAQQRRKRLKQLAQKSDAQGSVIDNHARQFQPKIISPPFSVRVDTHTTGPESWQKSPQLLYNCIEIGTRTRFYLKSTNPELHEQYVHTHTHMTCGQTDKDSWHPVANVVGILISQILEYHTQQELTVQPH